MKKLVVFDLDGTLLDTIDDLAHTCDEIMKRHAHPRHSNDEYRSYVGNGVRKLLERSLPKEYKNDSPYIDALLAEFLEYYHNHIADHTTIYDGIVKALETISSMGINIAVLSNKYHAGTVKLIKTFFPHITFADVRGQMDGVAIKPSIEALVSIMKKCGVSASETLFVGDTAVDIHTAQNAGVDVVAVCWGFRDESVLKAENPTYIAHRAADILDYL